MRRGLIAVGVLAAAAAVAAVIVATSSAGGGGNKGPYYFYSGVHVIDQSSVDRLYVENVSTDEATVKIRFTQGGVRHNEELTVAAGELDSEASPACATPTCTEQVRIRSNTPLLAPSVRYEDADGGIQEDLAGDFIVVRDDKRVF